MDIIYVLVPLSILLIALAITVLFWAIKNGQFEDMDSPAHKILFDDEDTSPSKTQGNSQPENSKDAADKPADK